MLSVSEIEKTYPELNPFFGEECVGACNNALVLIGESHYLPKETRCDTTPDVWYSGMSELNEEDKRWINTREIIRIGIQDAFYKRRPQWIWKLSALAINTAGSRYTGSESEILTYVYKRIIAFNFFMRPAKEGDSLEGQLDKTDVDIARERVARLLEKIHPQGIIILSSCVKKRFDFKLLSELGIPFVCTAHPGCAWWNRRSCRSGNKTGPESIRDFVKRIDFR